MRADASPADSGSTPDQTVVCVLGMHRSGTSVAARMLNLLGASLGPAHQLVGPADDNPSGFWEHRPIVRLNDEILARLGGNCVRLPAFPAGWECAPELDDLRARAHAILRAGFAGEKFWAWKDPRTCLTLPFWQRLLPPMRYVICVRGPAQVALSLERRSGMPRERALYLWLAYVRYALQHTAGRPRRFVCYDSIVDELPDELRRLAGFVGVPERAELPDVREPVARFIDGKLRHHRSASYTGTVNDSGDAGLSEALRFARQAYGSLAGGEPLDPRRLRGLLAGGLAAVDRKAVPWLKRSGLIEAGFGQ